MKNSVLAILMLAMVLSFGINAFASVSTKAVNARLSQLIPAGQPGLLAMGISSNGKDCEVALEANANGEVELMISVRSFFGTKHFIFNPNKNRTLTAAADKGNEIIIQSTNSEGSPETLVLGVASANNSRVLKSAEIRSIADCSL